MVYRLHAQKMYMNIEFNALLRPYREVLEDPDPKQRIKIFF